MRLEPASLGQVEVQITRPPDGPASVKVTAEQPQTLLLLVRDQPALQQALGRAGLTLDPQSVTFHLAPSQPATPAAAPVAASQGAASNGASPGSSGGNPALAAAAAQTGGNPAGDPNTRRSRSTRSAASRAEGSGGALSSIGALPARAWLRAGLDITA